MIDVTESSYTPPVLEEEEEEEEEMQEHEYIADWLYDRIDEGYEELADHAISMLDGGYVYIGDDYVIIDDSRLERECRAFLENDDLNHSQYYPSIEDAGDLPRGFIDYVTGEGMSMIINHIGRSAIIDEIINDLEYEEILGFRNADEYEGYVIFYN